MKFFSTLFCLLFAQQLISAPLPNLEDYQLLDKLGEKSDKSSSWHNYTEVYSRYFHTLKDQPIKFLEIGIFYGGSVQMWEKYFKNAELHFIDINLALNQYTPERAHCHCVDQSSATSLYGFIQKVGGDFDVILDDGGHTMHQQITSFTALFPHVKKGGMYIIEDLHTSYWKEYGGGGTVEKPAAGPGTCIDYLKGLVDELNYVGARTTRSAHIIPEAIRQELNIYKEQIYSIHFYDSVCIIIKR